MIFQAQAQAAAVRAASLVNAAASTVFTGVDRFVARPEIEPRVGQLFLDLAQNTHPDRLLTTYPDRIISHIFSWAGFPVDLTARPLSAWQRREYVARHMALSALIAPLLGGFLYGANPAGVSFTSEDLVTMVRRYFELVDKDAQQAGRLYPRKLLNVAFGDLNGERVLNSTYRTRRQMMEAIRSRVGYVKDRKEYDASIWPDYFLHLFHWRDWLDDDEAFSWDSKTELLFAGLYGAMQRSALPDALEAFLKADNRRRIDPRRGPVRVVEIGAGTGTYANYFLESARWMGRLGGLEYGFVEMSPSNMKLARERLKGWGDRVKFYDWEHDRAAAEALPYDDGSVDVVVSVNLFHELPPHVREEAAWEIGRVLRSGPLEASGRLVFFDSVQAGDGLDSLLRAFGESGHGKAARTGVFHEPYIPGYARENLDVLFGDAGMKRRAPWQFAYMAKGASFDKYV
ncbi:MAG TPA: class I SAM-dependent methyltransferase [bacterium]|nr:class I SAM-dependent methyltransferase [bacterium]